MAPDADHSRASTTISLGHRAPQDQPGLRDPVANDQYQQVHPMKCFFRALTRKKPLDGRTDTNLNRCLGLLDLTVLGVGSTLGLGLYVLAGQVASTKAGPAVVISFGLAALASAFSAICYAEFAGRVPQAGSAYAYSYITVGEFVAFVIGWNMVLEYVIGASSVARGFSGYLRYVCQQLWANLGHWSAGTKACKPGSTLMISQALDGSTPAPLSLLNSTGCIPLPAALAPMVGSVIGNSSTTTTALATLPATGLSQQFLEPVAAYIAAYFDWPSVVIVFVITAFILLGVKESTNVTLAFTATNMIVVVTVVLSALPSLDLHNWQLSRAEVPANSGSGGFFPYGWSGVLAGSATCFFGFIGFDTIASSAEEARNPKRNVPLAIILSLLISFVTYLAIAMVQTLLWPYYDQNKVTIMPYIFEQLDMPVTYWIVLVGAIAGLASSQLGGMYPLPRILYSMGQDKLIYSYLAHVNRRLKLPVRATIAGSILVAILACLLDIEDLADMVSIGTLAAYSLVSLSVLIVRYEHRSDAVDDSTFVSSRLSFADIVSVQQQQQQQQQHLHQVGLSSSQATETNGEACKSGRQIEPLKEQTFMSKLCPAEPMNGRCQHEPDQKPKPKKLLDLLIVWRRSDDQADDTLSRVPDELTSRQSKILIAAIVGLTIVLDVLFLQLTSGVSPPADGQQVEGELVASEQQSLVTPTPLLLMSCSCMVLVALAATILMLSHLPTSRPPSEDMFQVPLVPLVPTLSILVNTILMLNLSWLTWLRFIVWMSAGLFIYFTYGIWNSEGYLLHLNK